LQQSSQQTADNSASQLKQLNSQLAEQTSINSTLQSTLKQLPSIAEYQKLKSQLQLLHQLEYNSFNYEEDESKQDASSTTENERVSLSKIKRLDAQLTQYKTQISDFESQHSRVHFK
jgi:hypothetical protein